MLLAAFLHLVDAHSLASLTDGTPLPLTLQMAFQEPSLDHTPLG